MIISTKTIKSTLFILACSFLFTSCYTTQYVSLQDDYNAKLNGKSHSEIIELLGPPDRTTSDGNGGEILIYEVKNQKGHYGSNSINLTETKKQTNIFIGEDRICYNVKTDDKKPEQVFSLPQTIGVGIITILVIIFIAQNSL